MEQELEARQQQSAESLRGVHEQVIKLVDNMVQSYLGNVRRVVQRMTKFIDNQRANLANIGTQQPKPLMAAAGHDGHVDEQLITGQFVDGVANIRQSILNRIQVVSKNMHDFTMQWTRAVGKQSSPLWDRIPPRGVELWRDFWDTVRKQVRRINEEFLQLSRDMNRLVTGRPPSGQSINPGNLFYTNVNGQLEVSKQLQIFYDKMSATLNEEQHRMDAQFGPQSPFEQVLNRNWTNNRESEQNNLIDEQDDEMTKDELNKNVALRQQIQQEINIFGSIFDIMRAFIQRLRESATNAVRDVMRPGGSSNNNNDPVTPGPAVKPQVDKLLGETIEAQRAINGQAKPVLLPNKRVTLNPRPAT